MFDKRFLALILVVVYGFKLNFFFFRWRYYLARNLGFSLTPFRLVMSVEPGC